MISFHKHWNRAIWAMLIAIALPCAAVRADKFSDHNERVKAHNEDVARYESEVDSHNTKVRHYDNDVLSYESDLEEWESDLDAYGTAVTDHNRDVRSFDSDVARYDSAVENHNREVAAYEREVSWYNSLPPAKRTQFQKDRLDRWQRDLDGRARQLDAEQSRLEAWGVKIDNRKAYLDAKQRQLNDEQQRLQDRKAGLDQRLDRINARKRTLDQWAETIDQRKEKLDLEAELLRESDSGGRPSGVSDGKPPAASDNTSATRLQISAAIDFLTRNAEDRSTGQCAKYVRQALEAGGMNTTGRPVLAKDYGPFLISKGFQDVPAADYAPQKGDIVVIQPYRGGNRAGHIAMYNGSQWISDFKQRDYWAGPGYRKHRPPHTFYRP